MYNDLESAVSLLRQGKPPGNCPLLAELSVGIDFLTDFWQEKYLDEYIQSGGSKIKFITGNMGSGKSHLLELFGCIAKEKKYISVHCSAKNVWLHDFKELYAEILKQSGFMDCLKVCSEKVILSLGFEPASLPNDMSFAHYLASENLLDPLTKRELRKEINGLFMQNPLIDNNFAIACSLLIGNLLGYPNLEDHNEELLLQWLLGSKEAKLPAVRKLGLSPSKITKYNARHMLRSLTEVIKIAGYNGFVIAVDDLEILTQTGSMEPIRYTKMKREDAYESIRQLIDEIDTLQNILFLFAFDKSLLENEILGFKSYQALWMRIQNEIQGERFNRFTDIVDLDKLASQEYDENVLLEMSSKLAKILNASNNSAKPIDETEAQDILSHSLYSPISLAGQVNRATVAMEVHHD